VVAAILFILIIAVVYYKIPTQSVVIIYINNVNGVWNTTFGLLRVTSAQLSSGSVSIIPPPSPYSITDLNIKIVNATGGTIFNKTYGITSGNYTVYTNTPAFSGEKVSVSIPADSFYRVFAIG